MQIKGKKLLWKSKILFLNVIPNVFAKIITEALGSKTGDNNINQTMDNHQ